MMVTRDMLTREGFQDPLENSTTMDGEDNYVNLGVGSSVTVPFHYLTWTLLYLKDVVDFVVSILLLKSVGERNLFYCKLYFFSTYLVLQAFTVYVIDITLLRVSYIFTVSVIIGWCFHIFYKPYSVWIILNYMKTVIEEDKDQENKARRRTLSEAEIMEFYKGSSIFTPLWPTVENKLVAGYDSNGGLSKSGTNDISPYMRNDIFLPPGVTTALRHEATLCGFNPEYELDRHEFIVDETKLLGSGEFGDVFIGELRKSGQNPHSVAIKTTKAFNETLGMEFFKALLDEVKVMCHIGSHPNIVNLIGVCTSEIQNSKLWIVMELCENSTLQEYLSLNKESFEATNALRNNCMGSDSTGDNLGEHPTRTKNELITTRDLIQWAHEISIGMEFLAQKKVCHGDLALRNILLTGNRNAKIADFGLARKLYNYVLYARDEKMALPWRWMVPESLRNLTFSQKTDVWAYAVTLWEVFSLGESPWLEHEFGPAFISSLLQGMRLPRPFACPKKVYQILDECWHLQEHLRPTFSQLIIYTAEAGRRLTEPVLALET